MDLIILDMAAFFHVLPEDIEDRASKRWFDLWQVYLQEKNRG